VTIEPEEIGLRIRAARERKGWTQLQFALQANVSPASIQRWEHGQLPRLRELIRVAGLLDLPTDELVEEPVAAGHLSRDEEIRDLREEVAEVRAMAEEILGLLRRPA
jgi:transcriptional regulator with XRE-family HTH domain